MPAGQEPTASTSDTKMAEASTEAAEQPIQLQLLRCAAQGDAQNVIRLLAQSSKSSKSAAVTREFSNGRGETALWLAAMSGAADVARALLAAGANPDSRNSRGETPLWIAAQNGHVDVAGLLTASGADVDCRRHSGETALWIAACNDHLELTSHLLRRGANPELRNHVGVSPLWIAACNDHLEVVDLLLDGARCDVACCRTGGESPLWVASQCNCPRVVCRLLRAGADPGAANAEGRTPLWMASQFGHCEVARELLAASDATPDQASAGDGETPLWIAAHNGHTEIVRLLLAAGAGVNALDGRLGSTPAWNAAQNGHADVLRLLLAAGATPECREDPLGRVRPTDGVGESMTSDVVDVDRRLLSELSDADFSRQLHAKMRLAGFTRRRAAMQLKLGQCLESISRSYLQQTDLRIVGSYSEGWGSCLGQLDGTIDSDSDIDVTCLTGRRCHIAGICSCHLAAGEGGQDGEGLWVGRLSKGHVETELSESHPATAERSSQVRPSMDIAFAYPCCCYPPVPFLQQPGHLPTPMLAAVKAELQQPWSCHLIRASCPGREAHQLRVSTTFLEKASMRTLGTLQGQLFVLLKYLVKRVLGSRARGLKSYHAKTMLFHALRATPAERWSPDNLEQLLDSMRSGGDGLLTHFFVPDALVYLRKDALPSAIADEVQNAIANLRQHLICFQSTLLPIGESAPFAFFPFRLIPLYFLEAPDLPEQQQQQQLEYQHIYLVVKTAILSLASGDTCTPQAVLRSVTRLPTEGAYTARQALLVLCALKEARMQEAKRLLRESFLEGGRKPTRSVPCGVDSVARYLAEHDLAWQFCVRFELPIQLHWLPSQLIRDHFPARMVFYDKRFYLNFALLVNSLILELLLPGCPGRSQFVSAWFQDLRAHGSSDLEECCAFAAYTAEVPHLRWVRHRLLQLSCHQHTSAKFKLVTRKLVRQTRLLQGP